VTRTSESARNYAAFLIGRGEADAEITKLQALKSPRGAEDVRLLGALLIARGRFAEAATVVADPAADDELRTDLDLRTENWRPLLERSATFPRVGLSQQHHFALLFGKLAGDAKAQEQALAGLREGIVRQQHFRRQYATGMIFAERWKEADEFLVPVEDVRFELLVERGDFRRASEAAGLPEDPADYGAWFTARAKDLHMFRLPTARHAAIGVRLARWCDMVGEREAALALLNALSEAGSGENPNCDPLAALELERHLGLHDAADARAARLFDDVQRAGQILNLYYVKDRNTLHRLHNYFRFEFPTDDGAAHWKRLRELWTPGDGFPAGTISTSSLLAGARRLAQPRVDHEKVQQIHALGDLCAMRKEPETAVELFEIAAAAGEMLEKQNLAQTRYRGETGLQYHSLSYMRIGDVRYDQRRFREAAAAYDRAWRSSRTYPNAPYLKGRALIQAGDAEAGRALLATAKLIPLATSHVRVGFAKMLEERGLKGAAAEEWEMTLRYGPYGINALYTAEAAQAVARRIGERDPLRAAALWRFFTINGVGTNKSLERITDCATLVFRVHRDRALGLIAAGRIDEAVADLKAAQEASPLSTSHLTAIVPKLDAAGRRDLADEHFAATYDQLAELCRRFPRTAEFRNRAAWLAARCDRRLDEALAYAEEAVRLEPKKASYIDTLAEVYFRRGDRAAAIRYSEQAVKLAPQDEELKAQLRRFSADPAGPSPEER